MMNYQKKKQMTIHRTKWKPSLETNKLNTNGFIYVCIYVKPKGENNQQINEMQKQIIINITGN